MDASIIVAIITSLCTLVGVVITVLYGNRKNEKHIKEQTDLTLYRIEQLERKQDKHNSIIERMFKVEDRLNVVDEKIKVANNRIDDLEDKR